MLAFFPLDTKYFGDGPQQSMLNFRVDDLDGALEVVNSSRYGNSSILFTSSGGTAREFRYGVEAGMIGVTARWRLDHGYYSFPVDLKLKQWAGRIVKPPKPKVDAQRLEAEVVTC